MKIALVSLARRGGMVHFQTELANALVALAPTVAVCSSYASASLVASAVDRIPIQTGANAPTSAMRALNPFTWLALERALRSRRPDIVHVVGVHEWNPLVAVLIKSLGIPFVFTVHDPVPHPGTSLAMIASNRITEDMADAIVVMTRWAEAPLITRGIAAERIYHIPHGVYSIFTQWRDPTVRAEKAILYFGRMESYKGLDVLLSAFEQVRRDIPGWKLILAGSGTLPTALAGTEQPGIEVLNRYVADKDVASLMRRARVVVAPYTTATQSGAVATAYAFGRPVIGTDVGGLAEMVLHGKTGLVVPPNDVPALARAIKELATHPVRVSAMSRNALALARGAWSWRQIAREHLSMYGRVLARYEAR